MTQDGDAAVAQQREGGDCRQAEGHEDDADGAVGLLVLGLLGMRVVSHGGEPIGARGRRSTTFFTGRPAPVAGPDGRGAEAVSGRSAGCR